MNNKPSAKSLQIAAQCWCDEETSHIEMDVALATAFAKRLDFKEKKIEKLRAKCEEYKQMVISTAKGLVILSRQIDELEATKKPLSDYQIIENMKKLNKNAKPQS